MSEKREGIKQLSLNPKLWNRLKAISKSESEKVGYFVALPAVIHMLLEEHEKKKESNDC